VNRALSGADCAIYLPGLVRGRRLGEFRSLHVDCARACAEAAHALGIRRFAYVSALGVSLDAPALADQTKAEGERAVAEAFPGATTIRPSLVLGPGDHFTGPMTRLMRRLPLLPVVGAATRVQPLHVDDLATGMQVILEREDSAGRCYEAGGPAVLTLLELLEQVRAVATARCRLLVVPEWAALGLGAVAECFPGRPLCRDQVRLMRTDKVLSGLQPGLAELGIAPRNPLESLGEIIAAAS
jgi:NADH dehydrogenase